MRRSMAWASIVADKRLEAQLTNAQTADAKDKAKTSDDGARKAVRAAWSHVLFPVRSDTPGQAFALDYLTVGTKDRAPIPAAVYDKVRADGITKEKLGPEALWLQLKPLWPGDRPHLTVAEVTDWFAAYAYLPKLRDRVVLETAIREALEKLDPPFAYAEGFDGTTGSYLGLRRASVTLEIAATGLLVRPELVAAQSTAAPEPSAGVGSTVGTAITPGGTVGHELGKPDLGVPGATGISRPRRFYGSVEIDMVRPIKSFEAILNAVALELERTPGAKVTLTLEIEAHAPGGFPESEVGVVRDNAKQLKFKAGSTGFEDRLAR